MHGGSFFDSRDWVRSAELRFEADVERVFLGHLFGAKFAGVEGAGDRDGNFSVFEFGLDFDAGEAVELEILELFQGFGGATLEQGTEFDDAFHLEEALLGIRVGEPAVLGFGFQTLGAEGLEAGVGVSFEEFFGGAVEEDL